MTQSPFRGGITLTLAVVYTATGLNPYDLRIPCEDNQPLCYPEMPWIQEWMNSPTIKRQLGVDNAQTKFLNCNMTVNAGFYEQGQAMQDSAALLPPLIKDGIRLLVFAGDTGPCPPSVF